MGFVIFKVYQILVSRFSTERSNWPTLVKKQFSNLSTSNLMIQFINQLIKNFN
jgi:hypothetical protein